MKQHYKTILSALRNKSFGWQRGFFINQNAERTRLRFFMFSTLATVTLDRASVLSLRAHEKRGHGHGSIQRELPAPFWGLEVAFCFAQGCLAVAEHRFIPSSNRYGVILKPGRLNTLALSKINTINPVRWCMLGGNCFFIYLKRRWNLLTIVLPLSVPVASQRLDKSYADYTAPLWFS